MKLPDIQGNGLLLSITLTLLVGAVIVYYLNNRIMTLEKSIARQNLILSDFIGNVRNDLTISEKVPVPSGPVSNDATPEAKAAAENFTNSSQGKINVSDDSESDSDSDSDEDYSEDDETESLPEERINEEIKVIDLSNESNDVAEKTNTTTPVLIESIDNSDNIKSISLSNKNDADSMNDVDETHDETDNESDSDIDNDSVEPAEVKDEHAEVKDEHAEVKDEPDKTLTNVDSNETDYTLNDIETLPDDLNANVNALNVHKLFTKHLESSNKTSEDEVVSYNKIKVDELRKMANSNNLASESEINKMKKKELVALFTESNPN
tara:strand:+ start:7104 stop:8069 length:966 start_codon:yes stop_codon:yes gene_type:complete